MRSLLAGTVRLPPPPVHPEEIVVAGGEALPSQIISQLNKTRSSWSFGEGQLSCRDEIVRSLPLPVSISNIVEQ